MTTSPREKIRRAIGSLLSTNRFFGVLSLRMAVHPGEVDTIAGDGVTLTYSEEWVRQAPHDEIKGSIAHIVFGCALKHHVRRGDRDAGRWNRASRIATAELLKREDIWVPCGIAGRDLPIETIYDQLPEDPPGNDPDDRDDQDAGAGMGVAGDGGGRQPGDGQGQGRGQPDQQQPGDGQSSGSGSPPPQPAPGEIRDAPADQRDEQDRAWDQASKQAMQVAKATGTEAGDVAAAFEEQHAHRRDWQDILREYMRSAAPSDYSWGRPNRRFIDQGLYLPTLHGQGMGPIVIAIDTSGSVDARHVNQAVSEMLAIAREVGPERVHLIQCDTRVTEALDFDPADAPDEIEIKGRGGTDLAPPFDLVRELGVQPEVMVYMTDLEASSFPVEPDWPVIWAVENDSQLAKAPFGDALVVDG